MTNEGAGRIGWIGMGKMGLPICRRLQGAGFAVTALCRSDASAAVATAEGFAVVRELAQVVTGADLVVSAIPDDAALAEILLPEGALKDLLARDQVFIDISTVSPAISARVAAALAPVGCAYLRSPVSGSTATAAQGALTAIVSGPAETFAARAGFFAAFTRKAFLVGAGEEARTLKLSINAMVGATSALLAETLRLAREGGLDVATIMEVVAESAVASPLVQYKRGAITSGDYAPAFSAAQMLKDFELIAQAAAATGCAMPLVSSIREVYRDAVARGLGERDFFVLTAGDAGSGRKQ